MGRPKGSKNTVRLVSSDVGDNGPPPELSDDEMKAMLHQAIMEIAPRKKDLRELAGELRQVYKMFKDQGLAKKDIDFALTLGTLSDAEAVTRYTRVTKIFTWTHPAVQAELFAAE